MKLTSKDYRTLMWVTVVLIFVTPLVEPFYLGIGLALLVLFSLAKGMDLENKKQ